MLTIDDFKPITLEDKSIFDEHYEKYPPVHSDNIFTTLISWMGYANYCYTLQDGNLLIMSQIKNQMQFRPPSGKRNKDVFNQLLNLVKTQKSEYPLGVIDTKTMEWLRINYPELKFIPRREFFEYVYLASDLAELQGSDYSKIRNRLNKFKKNNEYTIEKITEDNIDEINKFLERWCLWKDCESDPLLENEKNAILYSMAHFFDLKLSGITLRVFDEIEAIAVYEKMSSDTVVVHYEKGSPDYDGIYKAINQETATIVQKDFKYINRESDMDLPGLRKAKMSYHPHHMVEVYVADRDSITF